MTIRPGIIKTREGLISTRQLRKSSDYKRILRSVERGELVRVRHGVYARPTALMNTMIDVERIVPNGVVCLYNAWSFYQLTTLVPPNICIAIDAKRKVSIPETLPIKFYYWKRENLEFGIVRHEVSGYNVRITDMERSVCDAIKYRNKIGLDICAEVVRNYIRKENHNFSRLKEYAERLRVSKILNTYLEIAME